MSSVAWVWLPLVASGLFGVAAPPLARRLRPSTAMYLLTCGAIALATSSVLVLVLVVASVAGQLPAIAEIGHWSARRLSAAAPFERSAAAIAAVALGVLGVLALRTTLHSGRALWRSWQACRQAPPHLVVLPGRAPAAYAVPGWPGRIVASRGVIEDLAPLQRRAVLAHEQAHLDGRHDLHLTLTAIAAAIDPLLGRIPAALRLATERAADEAAAAAAGNRRLVAETLAEAALAQSPPARSALFTLAVAGAEIPARVAALLAEPPRRRPLAETFLAVLSLVSLVAALAGLHEIDALYDAAARFAVHRSLGR